MHILLTRPLSQSQVLAAALKQRGIENILIAPLLTIEPCIEHAITLQTALDKHPQALLITSSNGIDSLAALTCRRDIPVIAVGEASAEAARHHGFSAISVGGSVAHMAPFISTHFSSRNGPLLYASGEVITTDITAQLTANGFAAERIIIYKARPVERLSASIKEILIAREPLAAVFYSPRTAAIFNNLVEKEQLENYLTTAQAFALSPTIATQLVALHWQAIYSTDTATQDAMVSLLYSHLKGYYGK